MQQPQYYKTVPIGEKPKQPDLYHTLIEHEKLGIEGLPCHNNYIGDPNGGYWEIDGESKVTHYLQPIPIPDAAVLRSALEKIADILTPAIRIELSHHDMMKRLHTIAREALSQTGDGWVRVDSDKPPTNTMVDGYNPAWIDEDYNPEGIRECFLEDEGYWVSAQWNNTHDEWDADDVTAPTLWRQRPSPPQPINP